MRMGRRRDSGLLSQVSARLGGGRKTSPSRVRIFLRIFNFCFLLLFPPSVYMFSLLLLFCFSFVSSFLFAFVGFALL